MRPHDWIDDAVTLVCCLVGFGTPVVAIAAILWLDADACDRAGGTYIWTSDVCIDAGRLR